MREHFNDGVEFARFLTHRFVINRTPNSATALTYTTLFAVVPMMTVMFSMLSLIPAFHGMGESVQIFIFRNFVPSVGEAVETHLKSFTTRARHLTWVGVVFLAITAFTMLVTIKKAFNEIWRVHQPRRSVRRFLLYWAIFSLGLLLLGIGFVVSTYITSLSLLHGPGALPDAEALLGLMPLAFGVAAFTLLYSAVPNARIPVRHAPTGGVFTTVLFEAAKTPFGLYVSLFPGYQLIYGAFATVPIFLLWIYLSWMIVLSGAMLVCNFPSSRLWRRRSLPKLIILLGVLRVFRQRQQLGQLLHLTHLHRAGWLLPEDEWEELLDFFEEGQFVCRVGGSEWVLCQDLGAYSLHRLLNHCPWPMPSRERTPTNLDEAWYPPFQQAIERLQMEREALFGESLAHWLADGTSGTEVT